MHVAEQRAGALRADEVHARREARQRFRAALEKALHAVPGLPRPLYMTVSLTAGDGPAGASGGGGQRRSEGGAEFLQP